MLCVTDVYLYLRDINNSFFFVFFFLISLKLSMITSLHKFGDLDLVLVSQVIRNIHCKFHFLRVLPTVNIALLLHTLKGHAQYDLWCVLREIIH